MLNKLSWYIAYRYFKSKKSTQAVSVIMYASLTAIAIATCAMFVILSVFSGLERFNIKIFSEINPDLKITPTEGKVLKNVPTIEKVLKENSDIQAFSRVIEEKVYVLYDDKDEIAYLKGVGNNFLKVAKIDTCFQAGSFPGFKDNRHVALGNALAYRLGLPINEEDYALLYMPKPGKGLITSTDEAFEKREVYMSGVFAINDQYENYIFAPIGLSESLLNLPANSAFSFEIKLKNKENLKSVQKDIIQKLGKEYQVLTRQQQDASFLKMMKVEQLFIYLIFILVICIASFNLAGAVIIIILDKKSQTKALYSLGYSTSDLQKLFHVVGFIIVSFGVFLGILLGSIITWGQKSFGIVMANAFMPFPVEFDPMNYLIVILTVMIIGLLVSFISSRKVRIE